MNWYYVENGEQIGPVNDGNLNRLLKEQTIKPETLVWRDGMEKWVPYKQMTIGAEAVAAPSATVCSECGRSFQPGELEPVNGSLVCPACRDSASPAEAGDAPDQPAYAGFWIRAGAGLIDVFILYTLDFALARGIEAAFDTPHRTQAELSNIFLLFTVLAMCVQITYFTLFLGRFGATPGKIACGLRVIRADGSPLTYGRALVRVFGEILSRLSLGIGYFMIGFDEQKRALHDRLCGTRVIRL